MKLLGLDYHLVYTNELIIRKNSGMLLTALQLLLPVGNEMQQYPD
ncbi:hypothetical protein [Pedobacter jeongneungensis]|nr:hypothetical protein [Pedobacter jeongneungensis]